MLIGQVCLCKWMLIARFYCIKEPGRYRIRISLLQMKPDAVIVREYVDSHSIIVEDSVTSQFKPSKLNLLEKK